MLEGALPLYDWPDDGVIVDVGGGRGHLVAEVLRLRPDLRGIVLDLPHVVAEAEPVLARYGVTERVEAVAGSFFDPLPAGHGLYVLASVLHDWDDADAVAILRRCDEAMGPDSRLLLFEFVLRPGDERDLGKQYDLHMLVVLGGRERTRDEWARLLDAAGLALGCVVRTPSDMCWLEATPATRR